MGGMILMEQKTDNLVFRQVAFTVASFDYLKEFQRGYERMHGVRFNNNQTLAVILAEHKQMNVDSGEQRGSKEGKAYR